MSALSATTNVTFAECLGSIRQYKYNPTLIQRKVLDLLGTVVDGSVELVDPTNPFIFLLEASAVNTAAAILETETSTRKLYPLLAQTEDDLYLHLSDVDFLNRFATPSRVTLKWLMNLNDLTNHFIAEPSNTAYQVTMPRETTVTVNGLSFMHQYPIVIRQYASGVIEVSYDATVSSPLQTLTTNIIPAVVKSDATGTQWLYFETEAIQMSVQSVEYPLQSSMYFQETVAFTGQYYYSRVYRSTLGGWEEIRTTHTDQVFDPLTPTAVLKVVDQTVTLSIPPVYLNTGLLDGKLRMDVYTTQGALTVDMRNFKVINFTTVFKAIDEKRDITAYTNALLGVNYIVYADEVVSGGSARLSFEALREQVLAHVTGANELPITNIQVTAYAQRLGFDLVTHVDRITNRVFLAARNLPPPSNAALITPAHLSVLTYITSMDELRHYTHVYDNTYRMTIPSKTVYRMVNGQLQMLTDDQATLLKNLTPASLADAINQTTHLYSPFYYVLDNTSQRFEIRAYELDTPLADSLSFIAQNPTLALQVSTKNYQLEKTENGYRLTISTLSDNFYKKLGDQYVQVQLAYIPPGESSYAYVNGVQLTKLSDGERVYTFELLTNHDLDAKDQLYLTNFEMFAQEHLPLAVPLTQTFTLFFTTQSIPLDYVKSGLDDLIGHFLLPDGAVTVTQESLVLSLGVRLKHLWCQSRSVAAGTRYATYLTDIPLTYAEDVYARDPYTGSIFGFDADGKIQYTKLHTKGETVLTAEGEIVYLHRKGDVVLNDQGLPTETTAQYTAHHLDLLLVDGAYYFTTDPVHQNYRKELRALIRGWITTALAQINNVLLEQTRVYYRPKNGIGQISAKIDQDTIVPIEAQQSFSVVLFVNNAIYRDERIRQQLRTTTIQLLNQYIQTSMVSMSDITVALKAAYGDTVRSFSLSGLGGTVNYPTVTLVNTREQLTLMKRLVAQDDDSLIVQEAVNIDFINYEL